MGRGATRLGRLGQVLLLLGVLAWPAAWMVDLAFGVDVTLLARLRTPAEREAWKQRGWDARDGTAALYGVVEPPPGLRVIVWDDGRLLRPPEEPDLRLLPLDRRRGEDVLPARALRFRAACLGLALGLLGVLLLAAAARAARSADPRP